MTKYVEQSLEKLEFLEFKASLQKQLIESAQDDVSREQYQVVLDEANLEIRDIQQRIGDEKRGLASAET
jgi:uncharacterized coiled-coil protein SlyX